MVRGLFCFAAGLVLAGLSQSYVTLFISFTLMPLGTAFLFPCVTALLSCLVAPAERGLQMGVQQTFGGVSRVAFPIAAGIMVDHYGPGVPFVVAGLFVLGTLMMMSSLEASANTAPVAAGD